MKDILNVLQVIGDFIVTAFDILFGIIEDLINLIVTVGLALARVPSLLSSFLPESIVTLLVALVTVTVLYRVLGRD